jgi:hypothetical protein
MQHATSTMNYAFGPDGLDSFDDDSIAAFDPCADVELGDALRRIPHISLPDPVIQFVSQWPSALQRAVRAVIWDNFSREARVSITFAWTPAYDYSITVYDVNDTATSRGGITVLFTSRYPDDEHPLNRSAGS